MATSTITNPFEDLVWLFDWEYSVQNFVYPSIQGSDYVLSIIPQFYWKYDMDWKKSNEKSVLLNVAVFLTKEEDFDIVVCEEFTTPESFILFLRTFKESPQLLVDAMNAKPTIKEIER